MLENSELLSRVDAILEKSRKLREEGGGLAERPGESAGHSRSLGETGSAKVSKGKIFAAMASPPIVVKYSDKSDFPAELQTGHSWRAAGSITAVDADLISLAARYSGSLETSAALGYKQKLELEELESRKSDSKMRSDILQKKLESESARLLEKEISLSKVAKERDALLKNLHHLATELEKMTSGSEETIGELREANLRVSEDQEQQRELFSEITLSIEREKEDFLEEIRDDFEDLQREKLDDLARIESDIGRGMNEMRSLEAAMTELKNSLVHQMKAVVENTTREEQAAFASVENEILQRIAEACREAEEAKAAETELRRQLQSNSGKLEETRLDAGKFLADLRSTHAEAKKELQASRSEQSKLEALFRKREAAYDELYEQLRRDSDDLQARAVASKNEHESLARDAAEEVRRIEEHIEGGRQRLQKLQFAIAEFAQENQNLKLKNEKTLDNLRAGLDSLVKGLAH